MTYETFKHRWDGLSDAQREVVKSKARWEAMSLWAVMNEWFEREDPEPD